MAKTTRARAEAAAAAAAAPSTPRRALADARALDAAVAGGAYEHADPDAPAADALGAALSFNAACHAGEAARVDALIEAKAEQASEAQVHDERGRVRADLVAPK